MEEQVDKELQDKYVDIFNLQADIERQKGPLRKSQDFKMAEELMYGKAAEDLAKRQRVESITKLIEKAGVRLMRSLNTCTLCTQRSVTP